MSEHKMKTLDPKTDGSSKDIVQENVDKLKEIFPEIFTEGKVDVQKLKETLGDYTETREERYNFTWHGKSMARRIAQTPSTGTLRPCKGESKNWYTTGNLFIEGDNLEVLKLLQKSYHKKVKMIYIDPPYNTGKEFIYPDNYKDNLETYLKYSGQIDDEGCKFSSNSEQSGRYHTNWLNMMYPRLKLARNLLRDDGVIFISIDDNEQSNLKKICDEIFGEDNFITTIIWEKRKTRENRRVFSFNHDFIICFAKNKIMFEKVRNLLPATDEVHSRYSNPDNEKRGDWQSISMNAQAGHATPSQFYEIETPGGRRLSPPPGRCWSVTKEKFSALVKDNRIWFGKEGNNSPRLKSFKSEVNLGLTPHTLWKADEVGTTDIAKKNLNSLFDDISVFDTPKPIKLMSRIIQISTKPNDLILDFFAGTSALAHAAIKLNSEDGGNRKFIMVQLPEPCDEKSEASKAGYETIAEIGKEQIRRAGKKIKEENSNYIGDLYFKVFKLDSSNIKPWDADFDNLENTLWDSVENIKKDRTQDDVLYELLLKYGLDLTLPIAEKIIEGKTVYVIGLGALVICLDSDITIDVVEGIGKLKKALNPEIMRVVFKDNGFKTDVVKTNAIQILKQYQIEDVKSL